MNDSTSILLATTVLALGGLGLYVFRTTHDDQHGGNKDGENKDIDNNEEKCNDENILGSSSIFNWGFSDDEDKDKDKDKDKHEHGILDNKTEETEVKPRKKATTKTQRNRKAASSSRRRYY